MAQRRPKARSPLQPEPSFADRALRIYAWARGHSRAVLVGSGALALLVAASVYYLGYRRQLESAAAAELLRVRETVLAGNTDLAIADLQRLLAQYGATEHAKEARVMLAVMLIQSGRPEEAIESVRRIAGGRGADPVGARAAFILGAALEARRDTVAAIRHYLTLGDALEMGFQKREALRAAARLQSARKDYAAAVATYRTLLQLVPEASVERPIYEMRLAELETAARLQGTEPPQPRATEGGS